MERWLSDGYRNPEKASCQHRLARVAVKSRRPKLLRASPAVRFGPARSRRAVAVLRLPVRPRAHSVRIGRRRSTPRGHLCRCNPQSEAAATASVRAAPLFHLVRIRTDPGRIPIGTSSSDCDRGQDGVRRSPPFSSSRNEDPSVGATGPRDRRGRRGASPGGQLTRFSPEPRGGSGEPALRSLR